MNTYVEKQHKFTLLKSDITTMVFIPASTFLMGAEDWGTFEQPVHEVYIDAFLMDAAPVTNAAFSEFVNTTNYRTSAEKKGNAMGYEKGELKEIKGLCWNSYAIGRENHPVVLVSWEDATAYAHWIGKRLPTEAEFEKAARGGLESKLYPWGNEIVTLNKCHYAQETIDYPPTAEIKSYPPNNYGLYDMCGNVWNWCSDWFGEKYYELSPKNNPQGPISGITKVRRSASFNIIQPFRLRCSNRGAYEKDAYAINIGFRCVKDI